MKLRRVTLLSGSIFVLVVGLVGCSGGQDDTDSGAATGKKARTGSKAAAPAKGAAEAVERLAQGLADGRPEVAWQTLPPSYREDVNELVQTAATKLDRDVWNKSVGLVQKLTRLTREKRDFILEQPMLAQNGGNKKEMQAGLDAVVGILETLAKSELADLKKLERLDLEEFLAGTGSKLMQQMAAASALTPDDSWREQMSQLRRTKATVLSEDGDTAVVRAERPGAPPVEEAYVQVEGHWIPKKMADGWTEQIAGARQQIDQMSTEKLAQNKQSVLMQLSMVEAALDQLLQTKSRAEFDAALAPIMGMAMGAMMAQAAGTASTVENSVTGATVVFPDDLMDSASGQTHASLSGTRPERQPASAAMDPHALYGPGEVHFDKAHLYVGQLLRVSTDTGLNAIGRLKEARPEVLIFERHLHGGSATFEVSAEELESLRVVER